MFQSTRPMRGATLLAEASALETEVSIHAPRAGRDNWQHFSNDNGYVSIHAPRAGRDRAYLVGDNLCVGFNPRAPCGARQPFAFAAGVFGWFQSTRPVRGATS